MTYAPALHNHHDLAFPVVALRPSLCLPRAIDRAARWALLHIYGDMTDRSSVDFLRRLKLASPIKITKILTDKDSQFTDRFAMKKKKLSDQHAFDKVCAGMEIEHRLAPPSHPQTNCMVERLKGRIGQHCSKPGSTAGPTWRRLCSTT